jgi:Uma2 family endonuclease
MVIQTQTTAEELLQLPDDGYRYELLKGVLVRMSPTGARHGTLTSRLHQRLAQHVEDQDLGVVCAAETGFQLEQNPDTVRAPDISFVAKARVPATGVPEGYWPFAPDLVVEVVSPGDRYDEIMAKVMAFLEAGSQMVWVVDPKTQTVTVHRLRQEVRLLRIGDTLSGEPVLPKFRYEVRELFAGIER